MSAPTSEELPWPGYQAAIDCWLCDGQFDPPCPFHPDATPASVLLDGLRRLYHALYWQHRARR